MYILKLFYGAILLLIWNTSIVYGQNAKLAWTNVWLSDEGASFESLAIRAMIQDAEGNIYLIGIIYYGLWDFDLGPGVAEHEFNQDTYVMKLNSEGGHIWSRSYGGEGFISSYDIELDLSGNVLVSGAYFEETDFDPSEEEHIVSAPTDAAAYLLMLNSEGEFVWVKTFDGSGEEGFGYMEIDDAGFLYLHVAFDSDTLDFDPGIGEELIILEEDIKATGILKLTAEGEFVWVKYFYKESNSYTSFEMDHDQNLILSSTFSDEPIDFDPGPDIFNLPNDGLRDVYILKWTSDGEFIWAKSVGSNKTDKQSNIAINESNELILLGRFEGDSIDLDPGVSTSYFYLEELEDVFILKLNEDGEYMDAQSIPADYSNYFAINGFSLDTDHNLYISGHFEDTMDFNPAEDEEYVLESNGRRDFYILKLSATGDFIWCKQIGNEKQDNSFKNMIDEDNNLFVGMTVSTYDNPVDIDPGYDTVLVDGSFIFQKYVPCIPSFGAEIIEACDSFEWVDGKIYDTSTVLPFFIFKNHIGCDSIVTLNLTIVNSSDGIDTVISCDQYEWIDGITYYESTDVPTFTLTNAMGCDSIVTLNLTINSVGAYASYSESNLYAFPEDMSYQWIDCAEEYSILPGETNNIYSPSESGLYAVEVTSLEGCVDTSACFVLDFSSIQENQVLQAVTIFPNPFSDYTTIIFDKNTPIPGLVVLSNMQGSEMVRFENLVEKNLTIDRNYLTKGVYILSFYFDGIIENSHEILIIE